MVKSRICLQSPLPAWLQQHYPFTSHWLNWADTKSGRSYRLHYLDEGPRTATAPIALLLHGNPTWSFYYRHLVTALVAQGVRVLVPDHLGCGLSDKPATRPLYCLSGHIERVTALLEHLQIRRPIHLVVHDWGGAIGFGWAVRHPEWVASTTILNTAAFRSQMIPWPIALLRGRAFTSWRPQWLIQKAALFTWGANWMAFARAGLGVARSVKRAYRYPYQSVANRVAIAEFVRDIPLEADHPSYATLAAIEAKLPLLTCPKILLWGMRDFCFHPGFLERWLQFYPQAEVARFWDCGHYILEDGGDAVVERIVSFVNSVNSNPSHLCGAYEHRLSNATLGGQAAK